MTSRNATSRFRRRARRQNFSPFPYPSFPSPPANAAMSRLMNLSRTAVRAAPAAQHATPLRAPTSRALHSTARQSSDSDGEPSQYKPWGGYRHLAKGYKGNSGGYRHKTRGYDDIRTQRTDRPDGWRRPVFTRPGEVVCPVPGHPFAGCFLGVTPALTLHHAVPARREAPPAGTRVRPHREPVLQPTLPPAHIRVKAGCLPRLGKELPFWDPPSAAPVTYAFAHHPQ